MELNKSNMKKICVLIAFAILLFLTLQNVTGVLDALTRIVTILLPFIIGLCLAFIINIPVSLIERKILNSKAKKKKEISKVTRILCIVVSLILIFAIILFVLFLVIPEFVSTCSSFLNSVPDAMDQFQQWLKRYTNNYPKLKDSIMSINFDWEKISQQALDYVQNGFGGFVTSSITFLTSFITSLFNLFIGVIFAVYILMEKEKLGKGLKEFIYAYLPEKRADKMLQIAKLSNVSFSKFITGQFTEGVIFGILCFVGMFVLQIPYALPVSIFVGFSALIPMFGSFIGMLISAILIVATDPVKALWFVIYILIIQQIDGNLIYPRVVGKSVGLPPMWVLFAIIIGGSIMGILGIIIAIPISSVLFVLLQESVNKRLKKKGMSEQKVELK